MSSHLLGEIEQICDHLVAIDGGRLLRSDSMTSFTQVSQVLLVEVDEGTDAAGHASWPAGGCGRSRDERALLVQIAAGEDLRHRPRRVADLGLPLNRMEQRRHRVEELFRDDVPDRRGAA